MEPLYIEKAKLTPQVIFDKSKEIFLIKGRSLPQDIFSFYEPLMNWFTEYMKDPNPTTTITFELEYFNSSSSKAILQIIQMLEQLAKNGLETKVDWHYQEYDEDTLETGKTFEMLTKLPFTFKELSGNS